MTDDPIMAEISAAAALLHGGDKAGARARFEALWPRILESPQPMHECAFSHLMADVQDGPAEELAWDLRALAAAQRCTEAEAEPHWASLHASLATDYLKLGDLALCRQHLECARERVGVLADDAYGQLIRSGIARIERGLKARETAD